MMVSGPHSAFEQVAPILNAISPTVVRCGERLGDGQAIKMLNNAMNAACRLATLEVVAMGRKQGLSLAAMTEAINQSTGRSRISQVALPALLAGKPSSDFALPLMVKDVDQAIHLSMKAGAPIPIAGVARALLQIGVNTVGPKARLEDMIGLIESMAATRLKMTSIKSRCLTPPTRRPSTPSSAMWASVPWAAPLRGGSSTARARFTSTTFARTLCGTLKRPAPSSLPTCLRWHGPAT